MNTIATLDTTFDTTLDTTLKPSVCAICGAEKITFDEHYNLIHCFDFIKVCPKHPAQVSFDISEEEMREIAAQEECDNDCDLSSDITSTKS